MNPCNRPPMRTVGVRGLACSSFELAVKLSAFIDLNRRVHSLGCQTCAGQSPVKISTAGPVM
jgi:hypothetical protein